ncbi:hypothetical protein GE21DRAFT_1210041, partial [Neurospora crassa]
YNPLIILGWMANMDVQLCTSMNTMFNYVVKYVLKAEKRIKSYNKIAIEIILYITARNLIK